jgi:hypothetical protein
MSTRLHGIMLGGLRSKYRSQDCTYFHSLTLMPCFFPESLQGQVIYRTTKYLAIRYDHFLLNIAVLLLPQLRVRRRTGSILCCVQLQWPGLPMMAPSLKKIGSFQTHIKIGRDSFSRAFSHFHLPLYNGALTYELNSFPRAGRNSSWS